jgi:hemerythrin-like domain-containing protein
MNITQVLSEEHQLILQVISTTLDECKALENGKEMDTGFFEEVITFIKNFADKFHHAKEEDILFKAMLENKECLHCNPIPVMMHEHEEGRRFVHGMVEGITNGNQDKLIENTRNYCNLLQQHIYKEDHVLYPMAEQALSETQKEIINQEYKKTEQVLKSTLDVEAYPIRTR